MARRMFSPKIIDTDLFLDMPVSARELYFQFGMRADDDGFIGNPKKIIKMIGAGDDDIKVLIAKKFLIPFESGVVVITSWHINNLVRKDWYQETEYRKEKSDLALNDGKYTLVNETAQNSLTQDSIIDISIGKNNIYIGSEKKEKTPSEINNEFFSNPVKQKEVSNLIAQNYNLPLEEASRDITSFIGYWTEPNKSGKKQRWELEPTFELTRRLATWFKNKGKFDNSNDQRVVVIS